MSDHLHVIGFCLSKVYTETTNHWSKINSSHLKNCSGICLHLKRPAIVCWSLVLTQQIYTLWTVPKFSSSTFCQLKFGAFPLVFRNIALYVFVFTSGSVSKLYDRKWSLLFNWLTKCFSEVYLSLGAYFGKSGTLESTNSFFSTFPWGFGDNFEYKGPPLSAPSKITNNSIKIVQIIYSSSKTIW